MSSHPRLDLAMFSPGSRLVGAGTFPYKRNDRGAGHSFVGLASTTTAVSASNSAVTFAAIFLVYKTISCSIGHGTAR